MSTLDNEMITVSQSIQAMNDQILQRQFYERDTTTVAQDMLGKMLIHETTGGVLSGLIVETEAYFGGDDPASHAARGKTKRSSIMFGEPGIAYVYLNYGIHDLLNVVTETEGIPGAVLIRALQPLQGKDIMFKNRSVKHELELTNGPGKLTKAMGIDRSFNGQRITGGCLYIVNGRRKNVSIKASSRIGISVAQDALLRYYVEGNPFVSKK